LAGTYLFEAFADYWVEKILKYSKELVGIQFWHEILAVTKEWEDKHGTRIHKGTPYFFLAEKFYELFLFYIGYHLFLHFYLYVWILYYLFFVAISVMDVIFVEHLS
jgi:hypothetical protein